MRLSWPTVNLKPAFRASSEWRSRRHPERRRQRPNLRHLPQRLRARVPGDVLVGSEQGEPLRPGKGDEHAVDGVLVDRPQRGSRVRRSGIQRELPHSSRPPARSSRWTSCVTWRRVARAASHPWRWPRTRRPGRPSISSTHGRSTAATSPSTRPVRSRSDPGGTAGAALAATGAARNRAGSVRRGRGGPQPASPRRSGGTRAGENLRSSNGSARGRGTSASRKRARAGPERRHARPPCDTAKTSSANESVSDSPIRRILDPHLLS